MAEVLRRIGVLTSGGDAPGMNAAVRAVARSAISQGVEAVGIEQGYHGLLCSAFRPLGLGDVGGILDRGGTFLGTSRSAEYKTPEGVAQAKSILDENEIDGLIVIGGDGSFRGAEELHKLGFSTVGIPGTIDNDIAGTDTCIGFDTALNTIADAVAKVRDTASSHERTFVIEVMGRKSGLLATYAGLACGADCILVPEVEWQVEDVCRSVTAGIKRGKKHSIIMLAEGAGHGFTVAEQVGKMCGTEVRAVVLGHVQRGGAPSAFDRILGSRMGAHAVRVLLDGDSGVAIGLCRANMSVYPLSQAYAGAHPFRSEIFELAQVLAK